MQFCAKFISFAVGFGDSLARGSKELWRCQNSCLSGSVFWHFLWPKVVKNHGVSKIHVFLHLDMLKFHSVGELSCRGCELEIECQIAYPSVTGKVRNLRKSELILVNFGVRRPHIVRIRMFSMLGAGQKAHLLLSFYVRS